MRHEVSEKAQDNIAFEICKFANGTSMCTCSQQAKPPCEATKSKASHIAWLCVDDLQQHNTIRKRPNRSK